MFFYYYYIKLFQNDSVFVLGCAFRLPVSITFICSLVYSKSFLDLTLITGKSCLKTIQLNLKNWDEIHAVLILIDSSFVSSEHDNVILHKKIQELSRRMG